VKKFVTVIAKEFDNFGVLPGWWKSKSLGVFEGRITALRNYCFRISLLFGVLILKNFIKNRHGGVTV